MAPNNSKTHFSSSVNVDTALLLNLTSILSESDNDTKLSKIHAFISSSPANNSLLKLLSNWSFYSTSNDHSAFIDLSVKLSKFTNFINVASNASNSTSSPTSLNIAFLEVKSIITDFYKDFLNNYLKVVYRSLSSNRPPLTNPVLRILTNSVAFSQGLLVDELINNFDFNLSVLPKLLLPHGVSASNSSGALQLSPNDASKDHLSIRYNFIKFWITLTSLSSAFTRRDLLINNNVKIMNNIWKYMGDSDSLPSVRMILEFVDQYILSEPNFKKSTKCKILSENFMFKIQLLFNRIEGNTDEAFTKTFIDFMNKLVSDVNYGLTYVNQEPWNSSTITNSGSQLSGSLQINNKSFRINNKLIYTLLTTLKPWESNTQLLLVNTILESNLELVPPYMNWIVQSGGGYHDPSLSSWWVGHSLLYISILQLPLPHKLQHSIDVDHDTFDVKLLMENVCLAPLSKNAIVKCLQSPHNLLRQFISQILVLQLTKASEILSKLSHHQRQEFVESVFVNLPSEAVIFTAFKESSESDIDLKLLKLTQIVILNKYESIIQNANSSADTSSTTSSSTSASLLKFVNQEINTSLQLSDSSFSSGMDLIMLDNYLSITSQQQGDDQDFKWWNKTGDHSFFTSLIKLSTNSFLNESLVYKNFKILERLTSNSLIFNKDLLVSPIFAIIQLNPTSNKIWNLLDETISRSVRNPYKYLDLSHGLYNDLSLFVLVLVEQFKFIMKGGEKNLEEIKWLFQFLKLVIVIGEPLDAVLKLINENLKDIIKVDDYISALNFNDNTTRQKGQDLTFFEFVVNTPNKKLIEGGNSKIPMSKFDIAALLFRLKLVLEDDSIKSDDIIIDLTTKLGNYLFSVLSHGEEHSFGKYIQSEKFLGGIFIREGQVGAKKLLVSELINGIFQQLPIKFEENSYLNNLVYRLYKLESQEEFISNLRWTLTNSQIEELIQSLNSDYLVSSLCEDAIRRGLNVGSNTLSRLIKGSKNSSSATISSVTKIIESNKVTYADASAVEAQVDEILEINQILLKPFIKVHHNVVRYLTTKVSFTDRSLICFIGYSIASTFQQQSEKDQDEVIVEFFKKVLNIVLENEDINEWNQFLSILATCYQVGIVTTDVSQLISTKIFNFIRLNPKSAFISEFAEVAYEIIKSVNSCSSEIEEWLHKSILFITKKLALSTTISSNFQRFVTSMEKIIKYLPSIGTSIWKVTPIAIVNTQLEAILNHKLWSKDVITIRYCNSIITTGLKNIVQFEKLLQIFINNEAIVLNELPAGKSQQENRFQAALLILNLFQMDESKNSTSIVMNKLLQLYLGSIRVEDLILKSILKKVEAKLSYSWISQVYNWDFSEELSNDEKEVVGAEERLILQDNKGFIVSLAKNFIKNSNENYQRQFEQQLFVPHSNSLAEFANSNFLNVDQSYSKSIYDPEFLMMLIINNEEIVKFEKDKPSATIDVKKLVDSNLLQFIVNGLSIPQVFDILKVILQGIFKTCSDPDYTFKDKNIFKVFVSNILNTLRDTNLSKIPPLIWYLHSAIVPILSNPGHFLYERTFRYVLSHPKLKGTVIPMYSSITMSLSADAELEGEDSYLKQISWLLTQFWNGITNTSDLQVLKFSGAIEWCLNLMNSPYINMRVRTLIFKVLYKIQTINEGSDLLVTRFGILTSLEQQLCNVEKIGSTLTTRAVEIQGLVAEQLTINIEELVLRLGITVGRNKRIREWTGNDMGEYIKRIHT